MSRSRTTAQIQPSAQLFRFCLRVLELRRPSEKINNQHLGKLLNLSPSDTSHWKHGKKTLKDIEHIALLSQSLNINLEILQDLADGVITLDEAWCEFYDAEEESAGKYDILHAEYQPHLRKLELFASQVLKEISIKKVPVNVTELVKAFSFIHLFPTDSMNKLATSSRIKPGNYVIRHAKGDERPHTRLAITREIAKILLAQERTRYDFLPPHAKEPTAPDSRTEIVTLSNAFLIPGEALAHEMQKISTRNNLVKSLADTFCVPKSSVRKRLTALLCQSAISQFN